MLESPFFPLEVVSPLPCTDTAFLKVVQLSWRLEAPLLSPLFAELCAGSSWL